MAASIPRPQSTSIREIITDGINRMFLLFLIGKGYPLTEKSLSEMDGDEIKTVDDLIIKLTDATLEYMKDEKYRQLCTACQKIRDLEAYPKIQGYVDDDETLELNQKIHALGQTIRELTHGGRSLDCPRVRKAILEPVVDKIRLFGRVNYGELPLFENILIEVIFQACDQYQ